nr:transposase [Rodentibacter pneumotropicus]
MVQHSGEIDIDSIYVHPAPRQENKKAAPIDYRLKENQNPYKRCVIVAREYYSADEKASNVLHCGTKRSLVFVAYTESQSIVKNFADKFITRNSRVNSDGHNAYDVSLPYYDLHTVNYKKEYRIDLGVTNNQAKSLFSRFTRMYYGPVH